MVARVRGGLGLSAACTRIAYRITCGNLGRLRLFGYRPDLTLSLDLHTSSSRRYQTGVRLAGLDAQRQRWRWIGPRE